MIEAGEVGRGASAGNAGWVTPTLGTPLAAPGILKTGLRAALDPKGALVIRPRLDPLWARWLWGFARSSRPEVFKAGVAALLGLTRRTLDELDSMRDAGVEFEEHRAGLLAVARTPHGLEWFDLVFAELRALGFEGGLDPLGPSEARELEPALGVAAQHAVHATIDRHVDPTSLTTGLAAHLAGERRDGDDGLRRPGDREERGGLARLRARGALRRRRRDRRLGRDRVGEAPRARTASTLPLVGAKGYSVTVPHADPTPRPAALPLRAEARADAARSRAPHRRLLRARRPECAPERGAGAAARRGDTARSSPRSTTRASRRGRPAGPGSAPPRPTACRCSARCPARPGLVVATGHGMLGVTLAPATGLAVAALVRGERPDWVAPFAPDRFRR